MEGYRKYLAESVLSESKVVTYRLLSRAKQVHPNSAKQILYNFHKSENGKRPGSVHATYLLYGIKKAESSSQVQSGDGDVEMTSSMPEVESLGDTVPTFTLTLIPEEQLEDALEQYDEVSSIHVYSLGPNPVKDLALLADAAQQALAFNDESKTLVITNSNVRRRDRKGAAVQSNSTSIGTKSVKQEPKAVKLEAKAVKSDPKSALSRAFASAKPKTEPKSGTQEEPESEKAEPSKSAAAGVEKKTAPALKRGGSNTSSIMQAFSKAVATKKVKKAEISQPATPSGEESAQPMSDDGEDDSEMPQPAPGRTTGRKTRKEREEELKRMMDEDDDEDDDDDDSDKRAESPVEEPMDETADEPVAPELAPAEPAETETTSTNGRRRGKRKVMRKKQIMDDQGYLVTIKETAWESFSEDEAPPPATKPKTSSAASSAPASQTSKSKKGAKGSQGTQGSIMSFFSKK